MLSDNLHCLLISGNKHLKKAIQYNQVEADVYDLPGIVSRKKQLLPYLTKCLDNALQTEKNDNRWAEKEFYSPHNL
jgi:inorganic pyrophosphatase/exopolyphosphatase